MKKIAYPLLAITGAALLYAASCSFSDQPTEEAYQKELAALAVEYTPQFDWLNRAIQDTLDPEVRSRLLSDRDSLQAEYRARLQELSERHGKTFPKP